MAFEGVIGMSEHEPICTDKVGYVGCPEEGDGMKCRWCRALNDVDAGFAPLQADDTMVALLDVGVGAIWR